MVDPEHVAHLETTAAEELEAGFLEGPFSSEAEVSEYFGHNSWTLVRRFVLVQGAELKLRPIDDCLEAQLNQSFTSTSYLKLQDIDYIAGLALRIAETVSSDGQKFGSGKWLGKCLDLSKAYKQMGIAPAHRHLAVIFFHGQDGQPRFYVANSLMFGATAAVYSFNRVSRSLWFLLNRMLAIPCGVLYDDFPLFNPAELACSADESASELLDLLGWRHARTGPKGKPFESSFQVLGCSLNLEAIDEGKVILENKPGRIDRLLEQLNKIKQANRMSLHEAQVLHGLLRYACGFLAGRNLHQVCAEVMAFGNSSAQGRLRNLVDFCDYATECLKRAQPRVLSAGGERRPLLVFTDGAWEDSRAGIGAAVVDTATGQCWVWAGVVPDQLLDRWRHTVGEQLICGAMESEPILGSDGGAIDTAAIEVSTLSEDEMLDELKEPPNGDTPQSFTEQPETMRNSEAQDEFKPTRDFSGMTLEDLYVIEICAGSARLSKVAHDNGFRTMPIDHSTARTCGFPICVFDLTDADDLAHLVQFIEESVGGCWIQGADSFALHCAARPTGWSRWPRQDQSGEGQHAL
eukprot:s3690_g1.t1